MFFSQLSRYLEKIRLGSSLFIVCVFAFIAFFRSSYTLLIEGNSYLNYWKYTHYLFDYSDGFVKRGLIGSIFSWFSDVTSYELVNFFSYFVIFILAVILCFLFSKHWVDEKNKLGPFLFAAIAITSPATIQHFAYDVGRFDILIYIVAIFSLFFVSRFGNQNKVVTAFVVLSSLAFSILIHEAAFFMIAPLILAFWFFVCSSRKALLLQMAVFFLILIFTYLVSTKGNYTAFPLEVHLENLEAQYGDRVKESSLKVIHNTTLKENLEITLRNGFTKNRIAHHLVFLFFMAPLLLFIYIFLRDNYKIFGFKAFLLLLSSVSPLALYPLGHDHFRWWSLALTNVFIVFSFLMISDKSVSDSFFNFVEKHKKMALLIIVFGLISGPIGKKSSFDVYPYVSEAVDVIEKFLVSLT